LSDAPHTLWNAQIAQSFRASTPGVQSIGYVPASSEKNHTGSRACGAVLRWQRELDPPCVVETEHPLIAMAYEEHPLCRLPRGDTRIWRYMDFTKLVSLLDTRALYFTNLERLSEFDPFEGLYTRANLANEKWFQNLQYDAIPEEMRKPGTAYADKTTFESYKKAPILARAFGKAQRSLTYVNCWHESSHESAAMWKVYLKSDEGIAIQSTVDRLKESLSNYEEFGVFIGEVIYVDFDTFIIPGDNLLAPYLHKRQSFEYEHELRALIWGGQRGKMHLNSPETAPAGLNVATDLDILIEKIYASPRAEEWFVKLLNSICSHYNLKKEVVQSDLFTKLY